MFASKKIGGSRRARVGLAAIGLTAAAALALSGCGGGESTEEGGADDGEAKVLTVASTVPPVSLDPYLQNVDPQNNWFINLAYDSLIRIDPEGNLEPDLATEWEFLDDANQELQLTLREGVTFSDGEPMTAEGVVASLEYARESGVNSASYWGSLETIEATDENTILLTSSSPNPSLPTMLTNRVLLGSIISPAGLEDKEALKSNTFGAGPYILDSAATVVNDTYTYTPNPEYWDPEKIAWDEVVIKVVPNAAAALQAVQNGEAQLTRGDAASYEAVKGTDLEVELVELGLIGVNYIDRSGEIVPELANPEVRKALNYAIDRGPIAAATFGDTAEPGGQLALPGTLGFEDSINDFYEYDPEKAMQILEEEGVTNLTFDIALDTTSPTSTIVLEAVVANWADIGVTANLVSYTDKGQAVSDILNKKFPVAYYGYGALTAYTVIDSFFGPANQYNPWAATDPELDQLIDAAFAAPEDEAQAAVADVFRYGYEELAWTGGILHSAYPYISDGAKITGVSHAPLSGTADIAWYVVPVE
ncbi:ABC transporter substrate-binding protein [Microbacterium sp. ET2]|uniref:ABC transporter substrate-binding protein n=1 Tax=Microbacterium albipurpureum TaxID=3050384 RepID=UPI00259CFA65|nr:ABC transporter substrate-binding protein [Microbacterium sp. ET2 (Ac-2212)]WJL96760.1 ABC transporter substrate-binding protein [Microbacterium sp. ET2 (Ac-2212)]